MLHVEDLPKESIFVQLAKNLMDKLLCFNVACVQVIFLFLGVSRFPFSC